MPRKSKNQLFGIFDEQAVSILATLLRKKASFRELVEETKLSKASLFRLLKRLERSQIVKRTGRDYSETQRGRRLILLVLSIAEEESKKALEKVAERVNQIEKEYRANHRVFHSDAKWERTGEKPLIEVVSMRGMTGIESLLFHQRFQEEVVREERWLQSSPIAR